MIMKKNNVSFERTLEILNVNRLQFFSISNNNNNNNIIYLITIIYTAVDADGVVNLDLYVCYLKLLFTAYEYKYKRIKECLKII